MKINFIADDESAVTEGAIAVSEKIQAYPLSFALRKTFNHLFHEILIL